ncbi:MAG: nucleosidase [Prevotellaceae bacterium]|jgi:adenosylhomocysteine nucleosidase|nr:nucleosidase [Prevotellaceae bacterium]
MKILVTYAVQGEFTELKFPGIMNGEEVHIGYLRTGIGKVKSAYYLTGIIDQAKPDLVINLGTAGTIHRQVGDIVVCRKFIDRDMLAAAALGVEYEIDTTALLEEKGYCKTWTENGTCNTGDTFLTELGDVKGDVVDMESFAQAFVCREKGVPFISVKYVTDILGQNSVKQWEDKLADARVGLDKYFNELKKGV